MSSGASGRLGWGFGLTAETGLVARAAFHAIRRGVALGATGLAGETGLEPDLVAGAIARLVAAGQANLDAGGRVVAVAGLSLVPARHELVLDGRALHTWCAWDAIGIAAALGARAEVRTRCPRCQRAIEVHLSAGQLAGEAEAVLWMPGPALGNPQLVWCPNANLFCGPAHLDRWLAAQPEPSGEPVGLPEAIRRGARHWAVFAGGRAPELS